jgi:ATP-binding cassette, subfamily B, multidrug efflux pump
VSAPDRTGAGAAPPAAAGADETARAARGMAAQRRPGGGPPWASIGVPTEKASSFGPSTRRLLGRLAPDRLGVVVVLVLGITSVTLNVIGPLVLGRATDVIFAGVLGRGLPAGISTAQAAADARAAGDDTTATLIESQNVVPGVGVDFAALGRVLLIVVAIYVAASLLAYLQGWLLNGIVQRTIATLRRDVEDKLHRLPLGYVDARARGELLSRVTNDIDNVSQSLQQTMSQLLTSLLTVVGVLVMMVVISPLLAVIALLTVPLSTWMTRAIARRSQGEFVAQWRYTGELNGQIEEAFTGHELVTVFGRRGEVEETFAAKNAQLRDASYRAQFVSGIIMPSMMFLGNLNYVAVAVIGALRVATGAMTLGEVQAFIQYSRQFTQPLTQVASMANLLQSGVASAERVFELLDAPEQVPDGGTRPGPSALPDHLVGTSPASSLRKERPAVRAQRRGRVAFEHVSFRYRPDVPLIDDLSLVAEPGQTVAIVGPTGAGKTTLVNLVMRFYELDGGRITLDGVDIATMARADLRSGIGMVLQDTWLFGGTIRENIAYGNPEATEEQLLAAARATYVDRFVRSLPDGYDTRVDSDGGAVSAGEKQLITIARAFLADPSLLILDEATSSVDTRTEVLVQRAMARLRSDRTSFVIAHRLSTIRDADLILVMDAGRIVEQGTHDELLAAHGAYYALYEAQFAAATL